MKLSMWRYLILITLFAVPVQVVGAKNIFDDDWTPPKEKVAPQPAEKRSNPPVEPSPNPVTPAVDPKNHDVAPPAVIIAEMAPPPTPARLAVPAKPEQAASRKLLKDVFAAQLADRTPSGRRKLAVALQDQAEKSRAVPVDEFVLLAAAVDSALEGASLSMAFTAADRLDKEFVVDGLAMKAEAAMGLKAGVSPDTATENVRMILSLTDELAAANALPLAMRACSSAQTMAAPNPELRAQVQKRLKELSALKESAARLDKDNETLKTSPDDPGANLSVGRYNCFVKGKWDVGLPMLGKGSDAALKALAGQELAGATGAEALGKLADGWWEVSLKQTDPTARAAAAGRAAWHYQKVLEGTSGLRRVQIEKRISEGGKGAIAVNAKVEASPIKSGSRKPGAINLLTQFNIKAAEKGEWRFADGALISPERVPNARIMSKYRPPAEYDLIVEFTRTTPKADFVHLLSHGDTAFEWYIGGSQTRITDVDGHARNRTQKKLPEELNDTKRHRSIVQVRNDGVKLLIDDKLVSEFATDFVNLSRNSVWRCNDDHFLGLGVWEGPTVFHRVEVIEISK